MVIKVTTTGVQQAQAAIKKALEEIITDKFVTVGIHEDAKQRNDGVINNATLGAVLHFGNDTIPARPWLDVGVATGNADYLKVIEEGFQAGDDPDLILDRVGLIAAAKAQVFMTDLKSPPNAPSTLKRKAPKTNPLIDTGALRQSVTSKVTSGTPNEGIS